MVLAPFRLCAVLLIAGLLAAGHVRRHPGAGLDGRPINGKFWLFYGALSSVEYSLTVTDVETGEQRIYRNPSGKLASAAYTDAF